ncbi:restriction endonuclease subunit S [Clostridium botulinum]|uniref:restriction endonuclease subunit S n=1 Tax=Clostridium botulinum TaxID=1491 RepID=UPI0007DFD3F0|nr:restriction endonuclease subunit S [Clostridium botulinum]KEI91068.1 hypothetical protein N491_03760 [Clostridium botulinum B2 275]NFD54513.1 restriction endonuclease subunit S [Clostridium botulinum]
MNFKKLSEIAEIIMGQSPDSDTYNENSEGIPFFQGKSDFGKIYPNIRMYCSRPIKLAQINDILMSVRAPVGDVNVSNIECCIGRGLSAIRCNEKINYKYVYYYLTNIKERFEQQSTGSTFKAINKAIIGNMPILIPEELEIQQKIVNVLDKAQSLIDKRKVQIEALDELVKSRFIEMFGDPITNLKAWNTAKLGDICTISRGGSPRPIDQFLGGPIPWIKIGDATQGDDIYLHKTKEGIIEEGIKKSRLIKKGGLIFANCGVSLGFARILKIDGCIHDGWLAFEGFDDYLDKIFFLKSLNYCTEYFRRIAPDGTQPNLNTNIMREYVQILPPMEKQKEYANFIEQVDKLKFEMEKSLKELEDNFNSLMQRAFKGELFN